MFVDASVVIAILTREAGWEAFSERISSATTPIAVSPLVRFEAATGIARAHAKARNKGTTADNLALARDAVSKFVDAMAASDLPISREIGDQAVEASMRYGKTVGHPADLNFGDCFAYACAKALKVRLLYKGNDFAHTDLA